MPQDLNKLLEESREKIQALVGEMEQYRTSRELHLKATDSLQKVTTALEEIIQKIEPYTDNRIKKHQSLIEKLLYGIAGMTLIIFVMLIFK